MGIRKNRIAQSTLEYILVITAIVALLISAAVNWMKPAADKYIQNVDKTIGSAADKIPQQ